MESGNIGLPHFADTSGPDHSQNVQLPFEGTENAEVEWISQVTSFHVVFQTLKRKRIWSSVSDELDGETIFKHAVDALYEYYRQKDAQYSQPRNVLQCWKL